VHATPCRVQQSWEKQFFPVEKKFWLRGAVDSFVERLLSVASKISYTKELTEPFF
jgi:hypothetical protein